MVEAKDRGRQVDGRNVILREEGDGEGGAINLGHCVLGSGSLREALLLHFENNIGINVSTIV